MAACSSSTIIQWIIRLPLTGKRQEAKGNVNQSVTEDLVPLSI
jgi:hypothetical protein